MSINSFFAEQYGITARNPFYSGVRITEGYDFFPKGIPSLDVAYARLVDSSLALNQILESPSFEEVDDFYNPGTDEVSPGYILWQPWSGCSTSISPILLYPPSPLSLARPKKADRLPM